MTGGASCCLLLQELQAAAVKLLTERAQQHATAMNHGKLTIDHMVLALAENPRCAGAALSACYIPREREKVRKGAREERVLGRREKQYEHLMPGLLRHTQVC